MKTKLQSLKTPFENLKRRFTSVKRMEDKQMRLGWESSHRKENETRIKRRRKENKTRAGHRYGNGYPQSYTNLVAT